ncbi:hypothetical protein Pmar_PMAR024217 [Perkinsus marinus ATCC 50983]|uniref:Uncharacterized protein n=1 Tax=Perkinsus marinus (strain ATCC 50983 / TXsc) TaxID=423536 RepID=C5L1W5_PERM5|nr:hypothetical protein Pmar_PMAR024217 [Perkinsus marinus ATCC 50983]EER09281.1 hypothetical protein Pmar_PMAR024217 [Perkinsus marinus ATCC 50983]|eukprot:XP_002777465.1 hypothetical protein Pmar_PMAR024217 [Perkinsus marinus ATCC 50983]
MLGMSSPMRASWGAPRSCSVVRGGPLNLTNSELQRYETAEILDWCLRDFALSALCSSSTVRRGGIPLVLNVHCVDTIHLLREEYAYRVILIENKEVAVDHGLPFIDLSCEASARAEISTPRVLFVGGGELEGVGPLIPKIPTVFDHHHSYNVCTAMTLVMFERYRFTKTWPRPSMLPPLSDGELAALREQRVGTRGKDHDQF